MKNLKVIFDFDSTIIKSETIEVLAGFALKNNKNKTVILNQIKDLTIKAMEGKIDFPAALDKRISLLNITKQNIQDTIQTIQNHVSNSFHSNIKKFNLENCFIISGGFKEIIAPIMIPYGFKEQNIFANSFFFDGHKDAILNKENDLFKEKGKCLAAKKIQGTKIIIGDGYTDYELKKFKNANIFILFTENIYRKNLAQYADYVAKDFKEVYKIIQNVK